MCNMLKTFRNAYAFSLPKSAQPHATHLALLPPDLIEDKVDFDISNLREGRVPPKTNILIHRRHEIERTLQLQQGFRKLS